MSLEMSVDFNRTTHRCIPEDWIVHYHPCDNLNSYVKKISFPSFQRGVASALQVLLI
jgi:hypothetical protein